MELLAMQKRARAALWFLLIAGLVPAAMAEEPALQPYELLWRQDLGRRIGREILIGSDWTCAASLDRQVSRYRLRDGARFWKHRPKAGVQAGLGGGTDGILGISDFPRGLLFCLDAETGAQRWTAQLGEAWTPPLMGAGRVYAASLRGSLSARDLQTGEELWHRNGPGLIRGALSLHDSLLIVPTVSDTLYALHRETGAFVWTARPYGALYGAPVACGGSHWTLSYEGVLMEWDLTTGRGMVRQRLGGRYRAGLAADGDLLIALSSGGDLQVLALPQLTVRWRQALLSATELPPVIRAGWVWVGLRDGTLRALRLSDGRPMVKIAVGEALATPVEFADSLLIVGTVGGDLRAYRSCGRPVTPGALGAIPPRGFPRRSPGPGCNGRCSPTSNVICPPSLPW